ncbi:MAG: hypothetical protein QG621_59 [Patescibacteria group bacterium]|jgi:hypothetical protein|nr:hypothetical protein [Patescibacteria group bacterium]
MELQPLPDEVHPNLAGSVQGQVGPAATTHPLLWVGGVVVVCVLVCVIVLWRRARH